LDFVPGDEYVPVALDCPVNFDGAAGWQVEAAVAAG
jgi:hypothetical protein